MSFSFVQSEDYSVIDLGHIVASTAAFTTTESGVLFGTNNNGNNITVHGAGAAGADLQTTISGNPTGLQAATLSSNAGTTVTGAIWLLGLGIGGTNGTTQYTITLTSAVSAGDLICVGVNTDPGTTVTSVSDNINAGNYTAWGAGQSNGDFFQRGYAILGSRAAGAGALVITVTFSGTPATFNSEVFVTHHSPGAAGAWVVHKYNANSGTSATVSSGNVTTTIANCVLCSFTAVNTHCTGGASATVTPISTQYFNGAVSGIGSPFGDVMQYQYVSSAGIYAHTVTQNASGVFLSMIAAFAFTPSGAAPANALCFGSD
jgi:hypothetical protein